MNNRKQPFKGSPQQKGFLYESLIWYLLDIASLDKDVKYSSNPQIFSEWKQHNIRGYDLKIEKNGRQEKVEAKLVQKPIYHSWFLRDWYGKKASVFVTNNKLNVPCRDRMILRECGVKLFDTWEFVYYVSRQDNLELSNVKDSLVYIANPPGSTYNSGSRGVNKYYLDNEDKYHVDNGVNKRHRAVKNHSSEQHTTSMIDNDRVQYAARHNIRYIINTSARNNNISPHGGNILPHGKSLEYSINGSARNQEQIRNNNVEKPSTRSELSTETDSIIEYSARRYVKHIIELHARGVVRFCPARDDVRDTLENGTYRFIRYTTDCPPASIETEDNIQSHRSGQITSINHFPKRKMYLNKEIGGILDE